jgi:membrane protease subunit (stomatin/prohibitin family)
MTGQQVGYKSISAHLDALSQYIKQSLLSFWQEYGLSMTKFYVTSVTVDTTTAEGRKVADALASQASMSITGHSWQQEQMFGMANNAVDQMGAAGGGNGLLAGLMAINMMNGMGSAGVGGSMMQPHTNQPTFGGAQEAGMSKGMGGFQPAQAGAVREVYCANCSKKHLTSERFCPHCGSEYHPCPNCGSDNPVGARRCVSCGKSLQNSMSNKCSSCGAPLMSGAAFCPQCGARQTTVVTGNICPRCGTNVPSTSRFCPNCGQKI